jgi:hypothetical protein
MRVAGHIVDNQLTGITSPVWSAQSQTPGDLLTIEQLGPTIQGYKTSETTQILRCFPRQKWPNSIQDSNYSAMLRHGLTALLELVDTVAPEDIQAP